VSPLTQGLRYRAACDGLHKTIWVAFSLCVCALHHVNEMHHCHTHMFVKQLFGAEKLLKPINCRYYPSREELWQMIYRRRCTYMHGLLDQEIVQQKIASWSSGQPDDYVYYQPSAGATDSSNEHQQRLLVVQQPLLLRYGSELVFLDTTYKTTCYALPLIFVCVHTNNGYVVMSVIVVERDMCFICCRFLGWWVSEQLLNGTSAQYGKSPKLIC